MVKSFSRFHFHCHFKINMASGKDSESQEFLILYKQTLNERDIFSAIQCFQEKERTFEYLTNPETDCYKLVLLVLKII